MKNDIEEVWFDELIIADNEQSLFFAWMVGHCHYLHFICVDGFILFLSGGKCLSWTDLQILHLIILINSAQMVSGDWD